MESGMGRSHGSFSGKPWITFGATFALCLILRAFWGLVEPADASPAPKPFPQEGGYAGPQACAVCHEDIHSQWADTRHAKAFSSPIFQQNWEELGSRFNCLECHTTGYDAEGGRNAFEGVTCEACHGPFQEGHPIESMPVSPDQELCASCHKMTSDEWQASPHSKAGVQCQDCHNPHSQKPLASSASELCGNCHRDMGSSFTHGTHAQSGLECSDCHMYTLPTTDAPIEGLAATGHTFTVGSEACIGCHRDTVHTRNVILELSGEVQSLETVDIGDLQQQITEQAQQIENLEARATVRLYTGLVQGAIVGLATGAVAAWIVSRRIEVIEETLEDSENE